MKHLTREEKYALHVEVRSAVAHTVSAFDARYDAAVQAHEQSPTCVTKAVATGMCAVLVLQLAALDDDVREDIYRVLREETNAKRAHYQRVVEDMRLNEIKH